MLSLDKTKSVEDLQAWLGDQKGLLSWKMDGLTIVLTYDGGTLVKAVTRGNGEIGEVITPNAREMCIRDRRRTFACWRIWESGLSGPPSAGPGSFRRGMKQSPTRAGLGFTTGRLRNAAAMA